MQKLNCCSKSKLFRMKQKRLAKVKTRIQTYNNIELESGKENSSSNPNYQKIIG